MATDPRPFRLDGPLPGPGVTALEASAGTGKTYTIAGLVVRYVAEGVASLDQILVVTFTRAATAELRGRVRDRLAATARHLRRSLVDTTSTTDDLVAELLADGAEAEVRARADRLEHALADFDAATISTIHGFCHAVLGAAGFVGDVDGTASLVENMEELVSGAVRDAYVDLFAGPDVRDRDAVPSPSDAYGIARLALQDPRVPVVPDVDDTTADPAGRLAATLARRVREVVDTRKRAAGVMGFDDLLVRLAATLSDPGAGSAVVRAFRDRFTIALVDEFQDTDPVQWEIVSRLFADATLVLIGDPKQAIYRFRGADVQAYLAAVRGADEHWTLPVNWRSDARHVRAVNALFDDTTFGADDIVHRHVDAAPPHVDDRLVGDDGAPFEVRVVPLEPRRNADPSRDLIATDLAARVTDLLRGDATLPDGEGGRRAVEPRDIAVLVRVNAHGDLVRDALARVGVPAVVNGIGSVFETEAAADWTALLHALDRPSSSRRVRALALTRLAAEDMAALAEDEDRLVALHEDCHRWGRVLDEHGVSALFRVVASERSLHARLLGQEGGGRHLTDLEHVAELLHAAASAERLGPATLAGWIAEQRAHAEDVPAEQIARRLETDADAVQVLTIHRSKGLEFPIVLLPYVMATRDRPSPPQLYRDGDRRVLDVGSAEFAARRDDLVAEEHGELLRLLYVAATRARHRTIAWFWWYGGSRYTSCAITKLLFSTARSPRVSATRAVKKVTSRADAERRLSELAARADHTIRWAWVDDDPAPVPWAPRRPDPIELQAAPFTRDVDHRFTRTSFTGLTRPATRRPVVVSQPDTTPLRLDEHDRDLPEVTPPPPTDPGTVLPLPMAGQVSGARFGTMVHAVLEHLDFASGDLERDVAEAVDRQRRRTPELVADAEGLARALVAVLRTPLPADLGGVPLDRVGRIDRLDELEFELPLARERPGTEAVRAIADLLRAHGSSDDVLARYAERLDADVTARQVHGFLTGSIDLVLRDGDGRAHVVDYKTNRLHPWDEDGSTWHYRQDALTDAMVHGHYVLQALLYQTALWRYLRWRRPDANAGSLLGPVGYLFVRGMVGPDAPQDDGRPTGVFTWAPPLELVVDLSTLLDRGEQHVGASA